MLEEIKKYRTMKEEIHRKHLSAAGSMIDDETKNALIQRGRDEARALSLIHISEPTRPY